MTPENCLADTGAEGVAIAIAIAVLLLVAGAAAVALGRKAKAPAAAVAIALVGALLAGGIVSTTAPGAAQAASSCSSPATDPVDSAPDPVDDPVVPATPPVAQDVADGGTVFHFTYYWADYTLRENFAVTIDVASAATATAPATIDPTTVDVDPETPGIQHTFTDGVIEATVDPATGLITVTGALPLGSSMPETAVTALLLPLAFTISDSKGIASNVATITFGFTAEEVFAT